MHLPQRKHSHDSKPVRRGFLKVELVTSASILLALVTATAVLMVRVQRVGQDARSRAIALNEVANELERCIGLIHDGSKENLPNGVQNAPPNAAILHHWPEARYETEIANDKLGTRLTVSLFLSSDLEILPISLTGWASSKESDE